MLGGRGSPWRVLLAALVLQTGFSVAEMGLPTLTGFIKVDLGLSATTAGLAATSYLSGKVLGSYAAGVAADRIGEAHVLVGGAFLTAAFFLAAMMTSFPLLFVVLSIAGFCGAAGTPAGGTLIRNVFPAEARGVALGVRQTGIPLGGMIAAAMLPWIAHSWGWRWSLAIAALVSAVAAIPLLLTPTRHRLDRVVAAPRGPRRIGREVKLLTAWGASLVAAQLALLIYLPLDLHARKGLSIASAATFIALIQGMGMLGRIFWGWVSDRLLAFGRKPLMMLLTCGSGASMLGLSLASSTTPIGWWIVVAVAAGFLLIGGQGVWVTMLTEAADANNVGAATGFGATFTLVGGAIGPPLAGAIADQFGTYRAVWPLLAGLLVLSLWPALAVFVPAPSVSATDSLAA